MHLSAADISMVVMGNFDVNAISGVVTFPQAGTWYNYFTGEPFTATGAGQVMNLAPGEYKLFINKNLNPGPVVIPAGFSAKVYPNPSRPDSRVEYGLPQQARVSIGVYNMMGQQVAIYNTPVQAAGTYQVSIRQILRNRPLSAGVYTLKITAGDAEQSLKIIAR